MAPREPPPPGRRERRGPGGRALPGTCHPKAPLPAPPAPTACPRATSVAPNRIVRSCTARSEAVQRFSNQGRAASTAFREVGTPDHWAGRGAGGWRRWERPTGGAPAPASIPRGYALFVGPMMASITTHSRAGGPAQAGLGREALPPGCSPRRGAPSNPLPQLPRPLPPRPARCRRRRKKNTKTAPSPPLGVGRGRAAGDRRGWLPRPPAPPPNHSVGRSPTKR